MKNRTPISFVESAAKLRALTSVVRLDIVDMVQALGQASIPELAAQLKRKPNTLYYHLRALTKAGLIKQVGVRRNGRHSEAVYAAHDPNKRLAISHNAIHQESAKALRGIVFSMLQSARREYLAASASKASAVEGPQRELWPCRAVGWLSPDRLGHVNALLVQLTDLMSAQQSSADDKLFALQFLLTPIVQKSPRMAKASSKASPPRGKRKVKS